MSSDPPRRKLVSLGPFLIDEFAYFDEEGKPTSKSSPLQVGGGGTYAVIGARIWLPAREVGLIVYRGPDFPVAVESVLETYGSDMWIFRDSKADTTRARNTFYGDRRMFEYITPRIAISACDLIGTELERCSTLHLICEPSRAQQILEDIRKVNGWKPLTIYEPIPFACLPTELPVLLEVLPSISIFSPNAEEALMLLSLSLPPTKSLIETAALTFISSSFSGPEGVIIRSGHLGAYVLTRCHGGRWVDAYWGEKDTGKVVDVLGAGNAFLGGLAAGLALTGGDIYEATLYATVSASYIVEQAGLPTLFWSSSSGCEEWNSDLPSMRLNEIHNRDRIVNG